MKMTLVGIQFTQEQARTLIEVSPGDLRHWRQVVPYLSEKAGKSARFSFGDLVVLGAAARLNRDFGVRIKALGPGIDSLFRQMAERHSARVDGLFASISASGAALLRSSEAVSRKFDRPSLVVPLDPIAAEIKSKVLPVSAGQEQSALPFAPQIIRANR